MGCTHLAFALCTVQPSVVASHASHAGSAAFVDATDSGEMAFTWAVTQVLRVVRVVYMAWIATSGGAIAPCLSIVVLAPRSS